MSKVHVIGAGPAGCIAAISAARSGHDAVVSEEHAQAGRPVNCSGLFSKEGLDSMLDMADYRKFILNYLDGANIWLAGEKLAVRAPAPVAYVCDRAEFDAEFASNAEREGAKMRYGECVRGGGYLHENVIGADGPNSSVASHFRMGRFGRVFCTMRAMARHSSEDPHVLDMFLSNSSFPGFFGWVIPHDEDTAEFGVGVELPGNVGDAWRLLMRAQGVRDAPRPSAAIIPGAIRRSTACRSGGRNVLLVGDAAGQVKATTGGGVIFGGMCARLAGRHATDPRRYDFEWRLRYGPDLGMHAMIRRFLSCSSDSRLRSIGGLMRRARFGEYLSRYGSMDRPGRLIKPQMLLHMARNLSLDG